MSVLIKNINLASISELNDIWAVILYKGHGKDKESDRSYRTISTCPILAKCLDIFVGRRYYSGWMSKQAPTQYQGESSSHDLASLLLTEVIQLSLYKKKQPLYALFLDAKSAFDLVVRQNAIVAAYKAGTTDQGLLYFDARLANRRTFPQWGNTLMGPICDSLGLEQGAVNSDRLYKLCNNQQLKEAQDSGLGVNFSDHLGDNDISVAAIGQADDVVLVANSLTSLSCLLQLTKLHCDREHVQLVPEKTKLLVWSPSRQESKVELENLGCPLVIDEKIIDFSSEAEHVGILRTTKGDNMPHIMNRISAHTRAISTFLHCGAARHHKGNPTLNIHLEKLYGCPVLLSGVPSLVLSSKELALLDKHYRGILARLQKLPKNTPACVIFFLAGSLPISATIHLRQLGLLGMLARKGKESLLVKIGTVVLLSASETKSWFNHVRRISVDYDLPDPLLILQSPPSKDAWKKLCRSKVISWWENQLRYEAEALTSIPYFRPSHMSLCTIHPLWSTAETPYEVEKAAVVAEMISGRYITDFRSRHWDKNNPQGFCQ